MKVEVNDLVKCGCTANCGIRGKVLEVLKLDVMIWDYRAKTRDSITIENVIIELKASKLSKVLE